MDPTQITKKKNPGSGAMLVTSLGLGSAVVGFVAGIFGRMVGDQTLYEATATGVSASVGSFLLGLAVATFVRKGGEG
ncbi:hypothetical protein AB0G87_32580 [Streptomyces asoensis]|uniref:hypothetical protein n=1 Tax=Streptomyces asoensis TaxID=249586 RepID=UPI003401B36C